MRNLKRALSLTLASVMLLGMMVLGTSAASYPDVTDEHNVEAIEVLQAVGVMSGSNSGNFNPDSQVTRIEMAIVMSNLLNLKVDYFEDQCKFTDVPAWAGKYVAACEANGIVSGIGNNQFGTGNVTATQAALMMLKALGYFQYASDFEGGWDRATAKLASDLSLFAGMDVSNNTALTRNQVAQLALNTLETTMVKAEDNTLHITTGENAGNINITGGSVKYIARVANTNYVGEAIKKNDAEGTDSGSALNGKTLELGENLYLGDLRKNADGITDDFGRPAATWTYKNNEIGTYAETARATFVGKVSMDTIYNTIGRSILTRVGAAVADPTDNTVTAPALYAYIDGVSQDTGSKTNIAASWAARNDNTAAGDSGAGVITEVFVDDYDNVYIAQHAIYVMQATNNYNSSKDTLSVTMRTRPAGVTKNVTVLDGKDFDIAGIANEDYLLYTYAKNEVQSVAKAEVLTGTVNSYSNKTKSGGAAEDFGKAGGWVKLDGQQYNYAKFASTSLDNGCGAEYGVGDTAAVVLDGMNNVLWVDSKAISTGNYVYISKVSTGSRLGTTLIAEANFTDGTKAEITVARLNNKSRTKINDTVSGDVDAAGTAAITKYNGWYAYSKSDNNEYTLTPAATNAVVSYKTANTTAKKVVVNDKVAFLAATDANATDNTSTAAGNMTFVDAGTTGIRGNGNTIFVVKDKDGDVKAYTGIAAVPSITTSTTNNALLDVVYMKNNDSKDSGYAGLVYIDAYTSGSIDDANNAYDLMFLLKKDHTYNDGNEKIDVWKAVVNGEEATVESKNAGGTGDTLYAGTASNTNGMYYKVKADSKNYVSATNFTTGDSYRKGDLGNVSYSGGTLILGNGGEFTAPTTASYTLITYAPEMQKDDTVDTGYEVYNGLTADSLASTVKAQNWTLTGEWYAVKTSSSSDTLKSLYVVVRAVGNAPEELTDPSDSDIKSSPDGAYVPTGDDFRPDVVGEGEDNIIFKFTTTNSTNSPKLQIFNKDGDKVYEETANNMSEGPHYFYVYKWCDIGADGTWSNVNTSGLVANATDHVGTKGVHGLNPGEVYSWTITGTNVIAQSDSFVA